MRITTRVARDMVAMALAFLGLQFVQGSLMKDALGKQERATAHRLCASIGGMLNKAHRDKDDLLLYQIMAALEKAPGVVEARLIDPSAKAHALSGSYMYALRDGGESWGHLALVLSDRANCRLLRRLWLEGAAASALLWTASCLFLWHSEKRAASLHVQMAEFQRMLETEKRKRQDAEKREQLGVMQSSAWLEVALSQIPRPLVLLDGRQRLAAANASAAVLLGVREPRELSGKSWQEVPALSECGLSLAQSLETPESPVRKRDDTSGRTTEFFTMRSTEGVLGGTWVRFAEDH